MRSSLHALLLLAAICITVLAAPIPLDFNDIERRWSEGQSEVCHTSIGSLPPCYVLAWVQSMIRRRRGVCRPSADASLLLIYVLQAMLPSPSEP